MIKKVFTVYDEKAKLFGKIFFMDEIGEARRGFGDAVSDPKTGLHAHPEDYRLYQIGTYDVHTGKLTSLDPLLLCASGTDYKKS